MMKTSIKHAALAMVLGLSATEMIAQDKKFTFEDIVYSGTNAHEFRRSNLYLAWWGDKLMYQDAEEWGVTDMKTGKRSPLGNIADVNKALGEKLVFTAMNATFPYSDKPLVLLKGSKLRLLYNWQTKAVEWKQNCEGEERADWSKASKAVAFVRNDQLCITDADGKTIELTSDGSRDIVYASAVYRNEFGIYKGSFWNNDGTKLAFYRLDQTEVTDYPQVGTFGRIATHEPDKYPMAGEASQDATVGVYDMQSQKTIYLKTGVSKDRYFTNIAWSPDSKSIYMFELNRDQNDCSLVRYDAATGERQEVVYTEKHDKYVHPSNPIVFLPWDSSKFIMQSEKDGYNHLYLMDLQGNARQLTSGKWIVAELIGFNIAQKSAIILSTEKSPVQYNLYAVDIRNGKRTALDNGAGVHARYTDNSGHRSALLSESGKYIFDHNEAPDVAREVDLVDTKNGKTVKLFSVADPWKGKGYALPIIEGGSIKAADGTTDLYYRMIKPADFNPEKKYPAIVYVYGGPNVRNITDGWHRDMRPFETVMAQNGYIVFVLDNRGSSDRGREFEQATFRKLGVEEMKDQMKGVEWLKSQEYIDGNRMGVHGWSFGGFMTISLMTTYPDVFKVGVAGGPVIDWKWYEVMYGERYMDTPQTNPEGYEQTSLINKAKNLKGKLQVIIGMNDPVVVPQNALQFIEACIMAGKQPDFFVYPGQEHNMVGHKQVHLNERIAQYFLENL